MFERERLESALLILVAFLPASAQGTGQEFRPEIEVYVNEGTRTRLIFQDSLVENTRSGVTQGSFTTYVELALRPVFRRALRETDDVFRRRYLSFRTGYRYITENSNGQISWENRLITDLIGRYPIGGGFVVIDRNRGDYRFVKNQSFSARYRNRLWVERDMKLKRLAFTPYVYDEIIFDGRYDSWTTNREAVGVQVPTGPHVVFEPYLMHQHNSQGTPHRLNTLGMKFEFYF
jgi:hypothetical protein